MIFRSGRWTPAIRGLSLREGITSTVWDMSTPGRDAGRRRARPRRAMTSPRWSVVLLIVVLGCGVGYGVFRWLDALAVPVAVPGGRPQVDTLEVIRTTLAVLAFIGALLVGLYLYGPRRTVAGDVVRSEGGAVRNEGDV